VSAYHTPNDSTLRSSRPKRLSQVYPRRGVKRILIVDDDSSVLNFLQRALAGYLVVVARDPHEALHAATTLRSLDLLITDYLMPSMTGDELVARMREQRPGLTVLILTAHGDILDAEGQAWWANETHLGKPLEVRQLRETVAQLIGPPESTSSTTA
jgi:DNA-binding NtrC family response regulator